MFEIVEIWVDYFIEQSSMLIKINDARYFYNIAKLAVTIDWLDIYAISSSFLTRILIQFA